MPCGIYNPLPFSIKRSTLCGRPPHTTGPMESSATRTFSFSSYSILFLLVAVASLFECGSTRAVLVDSSDSPAYLPDISSQLSDSASDYTSLSNISDNLDEYLDAQAPRKAPAKRRLVVRVPFAHNPDTMQLSRIYKSLITQQKQKKVNPFAVPLRSYFD